MPTHTDLQNVCGRALEALAEVRAHAVQLAQLEQQIKAAQSELAGLTGQIEQARRLASQLAELDQKARVKTAELAELDSQIARKHALHGAADSALRDLRKKISGDPTHA